MTHAARLCYIKHGKVFMLMINEGVMCHVTYQPSRCDFYNVGIQVVRRPTSSQFRRAPRDRCELTTLLKLRLDPVFRVTGNRDLFSAGAPAAGQGAEVPV